MGASGHATNPSSPGVHGALAAVLAPAARAVDYRADLYYPSADQTGLRAAVGARLRRLRSGGGRQRLPGRRRAVGVRRAGRRDPGLQRRRLRVHAAGGHQHPRRQRHDAAPHRPIPASTRGCCTTRPARCGRRRRSPTRPSAPTRSVEIPPGVAQFGPSLYARTAVPAGRIASPNSNTLEVLRIGVWLRDSGLPTLTVRAAGAFADGAWHRGVVCARADATDGGLGVYGSTSTSTARRWVSARRPARRCSRGRGPSAATSASTATSCTTAT